MVPAHQMGLYRHAYDVAVPADQRPPTSAPARPRVSASSPAHTYAHAHAPCPSLVMSPFFLRTKLLPLNTVEHSARTTPMYRSSMAGRTARERAGGRAGGQDGQGEGGQGKRGRAGGWVRRQNRLGRMHACTVHTRSRLWTAVIVSASSRQLRAAPARSSRQVPLALSPSVKGSTVLYSGDTMACSARQGHAQLCKRLAHLNHVPYACHSHALVRVRAAPASRTWGYSYHVDVGLELVDALNSLLQRPSRWRTPVVAHPSTHASRFRRR